MVPLVQGARFIGTDMVDFYLAGESGDNHLTETPENLQVETGEDFYGDILRDDIINLDEVVMTGKTPNEVPTLESASMAIRILPLPNMIDRQMASFLEERPSQEKKGKGISGTEPLSSCFMGVYSIKWVNRARWDVIIGVVGLIVMLFYQE
ncbi:NAC domain-containing protein 89-like [Brassica napus]|uniref:NAC domain-containing protein 89-like n=1 Tax=Brassica napus TaxID=3708 RepID=UPI002079EF9C|nr:NAC domain-containing protein 89-like [Brassica napus]